MGKKPIRVRVTTSMLMNLIGSALAKTIIMLSITAMVSVLKGIYWPLLAPLIMVVIYHRALVFEVFVMVHIIESSLGSWNYFSRIDKFVYLGGIPMKSMDHLSVLPLDNKVEAILSINEDYELNSVTIAGPPVSPEEWKKEDVQHHQICAVDFVPPSHSVLEEGADWMKSHIEEKHVVYVHCKSGIGRSASVVAAYYMKHRQMTAADAVEFIRRQRGEIFKATSAQMSNLLEYEKTIRSEQKFSTQP